MPNKRARMGILAAVLAVITLSMIGCSRSYTFRLDGVVRSAVDGEPLRGVDIRFHGPQGLDGSSIMTGDGGYFSWQFETSYSRFTSSFPWSVTVSADGFLDEEIDFSPRNEPAWGGALNLVLFRVYLRPTPTNAPIVQRNDRLRAPGERPASAG